MANNSKLTPRRRERFLAALREQPNVTRAARAVNVTRRATYNWREADEQFAQEWDDAIQEGCDRLEEEAWRRAHDGVEEGVYYQGDKVDTVRRYSDRLMERLLEAHRPERFRHRHELSGPGGEPLKPTVIVLPAEEPLPD